MKKKEDPIRFWKFCMAGPNYESNWFLGFDLIGYSIIVYDTCFMFFIFGFLSILWFNPLCRWRVKTENSMLIRFHNTLKITSFNDFVSFFFAVDMLGVILRPNYHYFVLFSILCWDCMLRVCCCCTELVWQHYVRSHLHRISLISSSSSLPFCCDNSPQ